MFFSAFVGWVGLAPNFTDLYCFFSSMPPTIYIFKRSFKQANKYLDHCLLLYSHQKTCVLFLFELQITFVRYFGLIVIFYISINFLSNVKFLKSSGIEHFRVWISVLCFFFNLLPNNSYVISKSR